MDRKQINLAAILLRVLMLINMLCLSVFALANENLAAVMSQQHYQVFEKYCFECHDGFLEEGNINIEELSFEISSDIKTAETWQKILDALNANEMPPEDEPQITKQEKLRLLRELSNRMVVARDILSDNGGQITMRRLNRREYQNTLHDLLGFAPNVDKLPPDNDAAKFDTFGDSLFFSSDQFEQYYATAQDALTTLVNIEQQENIKKVRFEPEETMSTSVFKEVAEFEENYIKSTAFFALPKAQQTHEKALELGLPDPTEAKINLTRYGRMYNMVRDYADRPEAKTGFVMFHRNGNYPHIKLSTVDGKQGNKVLLTVRAGQYAGFPEREKYIEYGIALPNKGGRKVFGQFKVTGTIENPLTITIPLTFPITTKGYIFLRQRDYKNLESRRYLYYVNRQKNNIGQLPSLWVDYAEVEGQYFEQWPLDKQKTLFPPQTQNETAATYAKRIISDFAVKAFRGEQVNPEFLKKLVNYYVTETQEGKSSREAAINVHSLILSSPSFLYISEQQKHEKPNKISDRELAIRLSYFLWSSPPDEQLLTLAKANKLSNAQQLKAQVARMLADPRSGRFIADFTHQWLHMKRLDMFDFSAKYTPEFDETVRLSARNEIYATIRYLIDHKLSIANLLKSDFVVIDNVLADFYGFDGVKGPAYQRVNLPENSPRGGLLGAAAIHVMGSDGHRSSPVERGAWVLRHLLDDAPPPAPANVPMLSRLEGEVFSARELQKAHQEEPQCAQCHQKIDPLGYAMENFAPSGKWRDKEPVALPQKQEIGADGTPIKPIIQFKDFDIDPSGALSGGQSFNSFFDFREAVSQHQDDFALGFTKALIAYSLGRPVNISDYNFAEAIRDQAKQQNYTIEAFISSLVLSKTFQTK